MNGAGDTRRIASRRRRIAAGIVELGLLRRRYTRHHGGVIGLVIVVALAVCALFAPLIAPEDPSLVNVARQDLGPGEGGLLLGADQLGRDILSRLIHGARIAFLVGIVAVLLAAAVGLVVGMVAGYLGGWIDEAAMRVMDVLLAFPYLLLAIAIVATLGPGLDNTILAIAIWLAPTYARLIRGVVLSAKQAPYVEGARAIGASPAGIMWRHLLPNCLTPVLVQTTLDFARAILMEAGLSFLGYGVQPPTPSWGSMIAEGRNELLTSPHIATIPGLAIVVTVLSLNLVGDALREALDPKTHG